MYISSEIKVGSGKDLIAFSKGFHVSGHATKSDLIHAIEPINLDYFIPVSTENIIWFSKNFDNIKMLNEKENLIL